ncbi:hypothetical protein [Listeria rocourtiae]|uniref:hypothetical protein n=1 Tax=Listeria rocourtiae TaxID=647910 RepID=UPI0004BCC71C|nr:hypothetical protein [Listeria rocourtiae]
MVVTLSILASTLGLAGCGTEEKVATTKSNNETSKQVQKVEENGKQTVKSELNKEKNHGRYRYYTSIFPSNTRR